MKEVTLLFLIKPDSREILLAMKKRGFGEGKFNGTGGKVEATETSKQATVREAKEEIGVDVSEDDLVEVADITFLFENKPDWSFHCIAYTTTHWEGEPSESEEMAPQWFSFDEIPYERMWVDDKYWLPQVLESKKLNAIFHFSEDANAVLSQKITDR